MRHIIRTFLTGLLMTVLTASASHAAGQACAGRDLMAKMKAENPDSYANVMAQAAKQPNGEAILWRIDGAAGGKPSWLLGTIHLSDDRVTTFSPAVQQAISTSDTVALEVANVNDKAQMMQQAMSDTSIILLPAGKSLWDNIDPAFAGAVEQRLSALGIPKAQAARLQPWLPATMLSFSPCQTRRIAGGHAGVDQTVANQAIEAGKQIIGLETIPEQLGAMSSMSLKTQTSFLVSAVRLYDAIDDYMETMVQAYLNRQITALLPFQAAYFKSETPEEDARITEQFVDIMIDKRNRTMAERARPHLDKGGLLIAVGALHLPGEQGLVALIRKQGFEVTAVE